MGRGLRWMRGAHAGDRCGIGALLRVSSRVSLNSEPESIECQYELPLKHFSRSHHAYSKRNVSRRKPAILAPANMQRFVPHQSQQGFTKFAKPHQCSSLATLVLGSGSAHPPPLKPPASLIERCNPIPAAPSFAGSGLNQGTCSSRRAPTSRAQSPPTVAKVLC